jgi:hypothetical protein
LVWAQAFSSCAYYSIIYAESYNDYEPPASSDKMRQRHTPFPLSYSAALKSIFLSQVLRLSDDPVVLHRKLSTQATRCLDEDISDGTIVNDVTVLMGVQVAGFLVSRLE